MPLLSPADPLPTRPRRVLVAGTSGSGKTTLAARLSQALAAPHQEIDALFHGPMWTPRETFVADVTALVSQPTWVVEWQYSEVRELLAERADLVVWLDLPVRVVMRRVTVRTLRRRLRRQRLWNGNTEPPLRTILTDRDHIVRWAWRTRRTTGRRVADLVRERPALAVVRISRTGDVERWLRGPLRDV